MDTFTLDDVIARLKKTARQDGEDLLAKGLSIGIWTKIEGGQERQGNPWLFESDREEYLECLEREAVARLFDHLCGVARRIL